MSRIQRKKKKNKLTLIIVLLVLCLAAMVYILMLVKGGTAEHAQGNQAAEAAEESGAEGKGDETAANEENDSDDTDDAAGTEENEAAADDAAAEMAASHVYSLRGSEEAAEMSWDAYDSAVEAGSKYLSMGFVVSGSGTAYIANDDYAYDMTGIKGYFSGMKDSQIDALTTRSGGKMIKLHEVFDKYGRDVNYVIELKYTTDRNLRAFINLVREYGLEDNVIVSCSAYYGLEKMENHFPEMTKLCLCEDQTVFNGALGRSYIDIASVNKSIMTEANCKAAHDSGKQFNARILDSEEEIKSAIAIGADSYYTDETELALKLEKENRVE